MRRTFRLLATFAIALFLMPAGTSFAHTGSDVEVTSNYRTRLTERPVTPGLRVALVDILGTMRITWHGQGSLTVLGYEGEPYLRISERGVERNVHSPATYLNEDRYANVDLPSSADASAEAEWILLTDDHTAQWHDHRNHWMSPVEPAQVQSDPGTPYVIDGHWEIPVVINGRAGIIGGELAWIPPPSTTRWILIVAAIAATVGAATLTRRWRLAAAVAATVGTIFFAIDTLGYAQTSSDTISNRAFPFLFPLLAAWASVRLWIHARRQTGEPTLAMMCGGLVLALLGGIDRFDVFTNSQIFAGGPTWLPRVAAALSLGVGCALMVRFLAFLVPLLIHPPAPHAVGPTEQATS